MDASEITQTPEVFQVRRSRVETRSTYPGVTMSKDELCAEQQKGEDLAFFKELFRNSVSRPGWAEVARQSQTVKCYWNQWDQCKLVNGTLYRKSKNAAAWQTADQYVVPESLRSAFFRSLHHGHLAGHQGVGRTVANLKLRFYWPGMQTDVTRWCAQCHSCGEYKPWKRHAAPLRPTQVGAFGEKVGVDLMGPFATTKSGMAYIIVMQDHFPKWIEARPMPNKAAITVADNMVNMWFAVHGAPHQLHSDQGTEFTSAVTRELCDQLRVDKTLTTAYRPQSNGLIERSNRSLQAILKNYVNDHRDDWDDYLPAAQCAYRATPHASTGISPYRMVYGREMTCRLTYSLVLSQLQKSMLVVPSMLSG